jgi:hypothetical protein
MIDGSSGWWVEAGWWVHHEIEHLQGGLLAEKLAAVAGDFANQPGASATMHNIAPESMRRMKLSTGQHSVRLGSFLNPFFSPGGSGLKTSVRSWGSRGGGT